MVVRSEVVVAPAHPKFASTRCVRFATYVAYPGVAPRPGWYPTEYESPRET